VHSDDGAMTDADSDSTSTTVVISRRVAPGREVDFQRWLGRLRRAVEQAPGYAGAAFHPPQADHPGQWMITYRFADHRTLEQWLSSPGRMELLDESSTLIVGRPQEQRLAGPSVNVTLLSSVLLRPGCAHRYRRLHESGVAAARRLGGLTSAELLPAVAGTQPETVGLLTFSTTSDVERWLHSSEREQTLDAMAPLIEGDRTTNVVGGFAGWFVKAGGREPKRWKQALVVFAALVPVSIMLTLLRRVLVPEMALVPGIAVASAANVILLTWVLMPRLTRVLGPWLDR
jgi:antibiotic biosynthesis monooxygenase (ABM) superfamily enzyme